METKTPGQPRFSKPVANPGNTFKFYGTIFLTSDGTWNSLLTEYLLDAGVYFELILASVILSQEKYTSKT